MKNVLKKVCLEFDMRRKRREVVLPFLGRPLKNLKKGDFIICVNKAQTMLRAFTDSNITIDYVSESGHIDISTIRHLPKYFNSTSFDLRKGYCMALKEELENRLSEARR